MPQVVHTAGEVACAVTALYLPPAQEVHAEACVCVLYVPVLHMVQEAHRYVAPLMLLYRPAPQPAHEDAPAKDVKEPGAQSTHAEAPVAPANAPALHAVHKDAPETALKLPALQAVQLDAPRRVAYVPTVQPVHGPPIVE